MKYILILILTLTSGFVQAQSPDGNVRVQVTGASGGALPGAVVAVADGPAGMTDAGGAVTLVGVRAATPDRLVTVTVRAAGYDDAIWKDAEVYPGQTTILHFAMTAVGRTQVIEEPPHALSRSGPVMNADGPAGMSPLDGGGAAALGPMPAYIRVWRVAKSDAAGYDIVENIPFEEYVKGVVPSEWYSNWHPESLKAGCVAARSYGLYKTLHPRYPSIGADVSDTTATQVYRDSRVDSTNTAADATRSQVLTYNGGVINAEYSAENADPTLAGPFPYQPSVSDPVCAGQPRNGHGRGLCQWGSQRWATGATGSDGPKSYGWILNHYYGSQAQLQIAGGGLDVGDCAMVQGGQASVRKTANGAWLTTLAPGTQVHVMEGPKAIGVSKWWRIAWPLPAPTRSDGWVADTYLVEIPCPPIAVGITGVSLENVTPSGATIQWTTDVEASSVVRFGRSAGSLGSTATGGSGTDHVVTLGGLQAGSSYFYEVESAAPGYVTSTSALMTFNTAMPTGDVNNDGEVTLEDAALALRIAAGMEAANSDASSRADVFGWDGRVTLEDAAIILELALADSQNG